MSYTKIFYHIILRTKRSEASISQDKVSSLYKYIWGIIKNKNGKLYRINGMEDHIHIFVDGVKVMLHLHVRFKEKTGSFLTSKTSKSIMEMKIRKNEWKRLLRENGLDDNSTPERG